MALHSMGYICSSVGASFYPQGLTLEYKGTNGPGKPRPLPQRNRMVQQNPRRRERRLAKVGPEVKTTQL